MVTVYRAMQVVDGKLNPPMAAKVSEDGGKTDYERCFICVTSTD